MTKTYTPAGWCAPEMIVDNGTSYRIDCRHCQAEGKACGRSHFDTIADSWKVQSRTERRIHDLERNAPIMPEPTRGTGTGIGSRPVGGKPASEKQVSFLAKLQAERGLEVSTPASLTSREASAQIDALLKMPKPARTTTTTREPLPEVHEGRYALDFGTDHDGVNQIRFYKVDRPTQGRWAGYTFVKRLVSDEEVRISFGETKDVLTRIAGHEQEAMELFGRETATCGHCGRRLTNDESRERGIGPVCAGKMGW